MTPTVLDAPTRPTRGNGQIPPRTPNGDDGDHEPSGPHGPLFDNAVLATVFFIGGETMLFGGLIFGFWILRLAAPVWPPPLQPRLPILVTGINTLVLLGSSAAVVAASRALRGRGDRGQLVRRLALAAALGTSFLVIQGYEWARLVRFGLTVSSGAYGGTFYTLIGAHGLHVFGALIWLGLTALLASQGRLLDGRRGAVRACALYWHFVVALWPILYVTVYLL
ncbi:MAG: heme-copper oxidase subunit III [Candidatus Rokubacteria bacterium]|nr:heme-copper oxidase subunit III [Candidatus Rokubacteria bacterium]